jgi:spermidine dehydrogenase
LSDKTRFSAPDRRLGMDRPITRRDFLNGVAAGTAAWAAGAGFGPVFAAADLAADLGGSAASPSAQDGFGYYPPRLTGLRGSHPGAFEAAHALRDGETFPDAADSGEEYDLIVVGGGISGLAAAHFYRAHPSAASRILILDNHDDFGGHAKRNEFDLNGHLHLMNGGTLEIDSPRPYGPVAAGLLTTLGIDVPALAKQVVHPEFYQHLGLGNAVFFDRETFGADRLVAGWQQRPLREVLAETPLSPAARADVERLETGHVDYLPGLSSDEKKQRLSRMSYEAFLSDVAKVDPAVVKLYHGRTLGEWGVGTDAVSALDCWGFGFPGFKGLHLAKGSIGRMGPTAAGYEDTGGSYKLHFPDGNATIARALVRDLLPEAVPGASAADLITARVDYGALDRADSPVRLRLNSIVIRARNVGDPQTASGVEVIYLRAGRPIRVRGRATVLACYNMMIPYLCPELPETQKAALHSLVKTPLVYTSVALRNWQAFHRLKVQQVYAPNGYHSYFHLNPQIDIGAYVSPSSPDEPMLVHMVRTPCRAGLPEHEQNRVGRAELLATPFETFERNIRDQLGRTLAAGGFDPAADITAITVNRWPHGYAPEYNPLFEPELPESLQPHVLGRARFGRIVIANSDAGGAAYTDSAIDQGHRAVLELLRT